MSDRNTTALMFTEEVDVIKILIVSGLIGCANKKLRRVVGCER